MPGLIVLSADASWKTTGWAISDAKGPIVFGDARLSGDWRYAKAQVLVRELRAEAVDLAIGRDATPIAVIERAGTHYSWQDAKRQAGDKRGADPTVVVRGLSECVGAIALGTVWPGWGYPWLIEPNDWRAWWNLRGRREGLKRAALALVGAHWPAIHRVLVRRGDEGDVAEAILLGVGAARRESEAPTGPKRTISGVADVWGRLA